MLDCQRMGSLLFAYYVESHPKSIDVKDLQKDILNISDTSKTKRNLLLKEKG